MQPAHPSCRITTHGGPGHNDKRAGGAAPFGSTKGPHVQGRTQGMLSACWLAEESVVLAQRLQRPRPGALLPPRGFSFTTPWLGVQFNYVGRIDVHIPMRPDMHCNVSPKLGPKRAYYVSRNRGPTSGGTRTVSWLWSSRWDGGSEDERLGHRSLRSGCCAGRTSDAHDSF